MSNMKNFMMDVEEFCNGYYYDGIKDFTVDEVDFSLDEVLEDVEMYFKSSKATQYAEQYLIQKIGEQQ